MSELQNCLSARCRRRDPAQGRHTDDGPFAFRDTTAGAHASPGIPRRQTSLPRRRDAQSDERECSADSSSRPRAFRHARGMDEAATAPSSTRRRAAPVGLPPFHAHSIRRRTIKWPQGFFFTQTSKDDRRGEGEKRTVSQLFRPSDFRRQSLLGHCAFRRESLNLRFE